MISIKHFNNITFMAAATHGLLAFNDVKAH